MNGTSYQFNTMEDAAEYNINKNGEKGTTLKCEVSDKFLEAEDVNHEVVTEDTTRALIYNISETPPVHITLICALQVRKLCL